MKKQKKLKLKMRIQMRILMYKVKKIQKILKAINKVRLMISNLKKHKYKENNLLKIKCNIIIMIEIFNTNI